MSLLMTSSRLHAGLATFFGTKLEYRHYGGEDALSRGDVNSGEVLVHDVFQVFHVGVLPQAAQTRHASIFTKKEITCKVISHEMFWQKRRQILCY